MLFKILNFKSNLPIFKLYCQIAVNAVYQCGFFPQPINFNHHFILFELFKVYCDRMRSILRVARSHLEFHSRVKLYLKWPYTSLQSETSVKWVLQNLDSLTSFLVIWSLIANMYHIFLFTLDWINKDYGVFLSFLRLSKWEILPQLQWDWKRVKLFLSFKT